MALNTRPLDCESSALTTKPLFKEVSIKDIEKCEVIGGGSFGTTFIAKFNAKEVTLKQSCMCVMKMKSILYF